MSFIELASLVTIFAFIVGIFSIWNGRMTRRQISQDLDGISKQIARMDERHTELMNKMSNTDEHHTELMNKIIELLSKKK